MHRFHVLLRLLFILCLCQAYARPVRFGKVLNLADFIYLHSLNDVSMKLFLRQFRVDRMISTLRSL